MALCFFFLLVASHLNADQKIHPLFYTARMSWVMLLFQPYENYLMAIMSKLWWWKIKHTLSIWCSIALQLNFMCTVYDLFEMRIGFSLVFDVWYNTRLFDSLKRWQSWNNGTLWHWLMASDTGQFQTRIQNKNENMRNEYHFKVLFCTLNPIIVCHSIGLSSIWYDGFSLSPSLSVFRWLSTQMIVFEIVSSKN